MMKLIAATMMSLVIFAASAKAEDDHLLGFKMSDLNRVVPPANPYTLHNPFSLGSQSCTLSKPIYFLAEASKNGGDDPRSGTAGNFVCYKAHCIGAQQGLIAADTQFGVHSIRPQSAKIVCLPADRHVCGDNGLDPGEQCDGSAGTCPGTQQCGTGCTCIDTCATSAGNSQACQGVATNNLCGVCCAFHPACQAACDPAVSNSCTDGAANDACTAQVNASCFNLCCN